MNKAKKKGEDIGEKEKELLDWRNKRPPSPFFNKLGLTHLQNNIGKDLSYFKITTPKPKQGQIITIQQTTKNLWNIIISGTWPTTRTNVLSKPKL